MNNRHKLFVALGAGALAAPVSRLICFSPWKWPPRADCWRSEAFAARSTLSNSQSPKPPSGTRSQFSTNST